MNRLARAEITQILLDLRREDVDQATAADRLFEALYDELRRLAGRLLRDERRGHTLQPTALVHETYLRLVDDSRVEWEKRAHFLGIAASAMRQVLIDYARKRAAIKRGGAWRRVTFDDQIGLPAPEMEILDLDRALSQLANMDMRMSRVVELRVFSGMTMGEIAHVLDVSERTVHNDWAVAKMWLARELSRGEAEREGGGSEEGPSSAKTP